MLNAQGCSWAISLAVFLGLSAACGDDGSKPSSDASGGTGGVTGSGVSPTKTLTELTAAEDTLLCDWAAAHFGGYGHKEDCPDPRLAYWAPPDLETCLSSMATTCTATVADYESCMIAVTADPCNGTTIFGTAPCAGLSRCGTP